MRALDALEAGDQAEATLILLEALEGGSIERTYHCPRCPAAFEWPGLLDHHVRFSHWSGASVSEAA